MFLCLKKRSFWNTLNNSFEIDPILNSKLDYFSHFSKTIFKSSYSRQLNIDQLNSRFFKVPPCGVKSQRFSFLNKDIFQNRSSFAVNIFVNVIFR